MKSYTPCSQLKVRLPPAFAFFFLLDFFDPDHQSDMFLRNVGFMYENIKYGFDFKNVIVLQGVL
jgi:hypothetical protein